MATNSAIELVNEALADLGSEPITDFSDATRKGRAAKRVYPRTIRWLLSMYPWVCTMATSELAPLAETPDPADGRLTNGWLYGYSLPSGTLGSPTKYLDNPRLPDRSLTDFELIAGNMYCDSSRVWATAQYDADPLIWPPYLYAAGVAVLAARLVMPVTGNAGILAGKQAEAWGSPSENFRGGLMGAAIQADSRNTPSPVVASYDPLTAARYS